MKKFIIYTLLSTFSLFCGCTSANDTVYEDGTYCATVQGTDAVTGENSAYTADVAVVNQRLVHISWPEDKWIDHSFYLNTTIDEGHARFSSENENFIVTLTGKGGSCEEKNHEEQGAFTEYAESGTGLTRTSTFGHVNSLEHTVDSLQEQLVALQAKNHNLQKFAFVENTRGNLKIYKTNGLGIDFETNRPQVKDKKIKFCIPAAFTSPKNEVVGAFINQGKVMHTQVSTGLNGGLAIYNDKVEFISTGDSLANILERVKSLNGDFFQQCLLIYKSTPVPCHLFGERKIRCRAIALLHDEIVIIESKVSMGINAFTMELIGIGVQDALYTVMGPWSEGWYRRNDNTIVPIGNNRYSTARQTSWITFR